MMDFRVILSISLFLIIWGSVICALILLIKKFNIDRTIAVLGLIVTAVGSSIAIPMFANFLGNSGIEVPQDGSDKEEGESPDEGIVDGTGVESGEEATSTSTPGSDGASIQPGEEATGASTPSGDGTGIEPGEEAAGTSTLGGDGTGIEPREEATGTSTLSGDGDNGVVKVPAPPSIPENFTGWRINADGSRQWYNLDGSLCTNSWLNYGGYTYYLDSNGFPITSKMCFIKDNTFYFDQFGHMASGWIEYDNKLYYFEPGTGVMLHDTWKAKDDITYYLSQGGYACIDCVYEIGGIWYKFDSNGVASVIADAKISDDFKVLVDKNNEYIFQVQGEATSSVGITQISFAITTPTSSWPYGTSYYNPPIKYIDLGEVINETLNGNCINFGNETNGNYHLKVTIYDLNGNSVQKEASWNYGN